MIVSWLLKFRVSFLRIPVARHIHLHSAVMKNKNSLPDRWTDYIPVGQRIPGTRFIAFKVPLTTIYDTKLATWQRFSPSDLVKEVEKQNEELGLVVDLTCTKRYYSPWEFPKKIKYSKIFTIGHEVPSDDVIKKFKRTVNQYLNQNSENDKLVGVHCTHGLNRTGYLICRYLIDLLSMQPSEAIERFNNSRGHSIERSNYLSDLLEGRTRSNAGLDKPLDNIQQHFPRKNANSTPPCPKEQPRSYGHTNETPRPGPRTPGPPFVQPRFPPHVPGQLKGPQHRFPNSSERFPVHGPRIPAPDFPCMPGPWNSFPQMNGNPSHQFRGPNRQKHYPPRSDPQQRDYNAVSGPQSQDYRPRFPKQSPNNPGKFPSQPAQPQLNGRNKPYKRHPGPGLKKKPKKQWQ